MKTAYFSLLLSCLLPTLSAMADTFGDNFSSNSYSNQDGNQNWSTDWVEVNDNGSPASGDIRIGGGGELRLKDNDRSISRQLDLSVYTAATLAFDYREQQFDNNNDWVEIQIRTAAGSWNTLERFAGRFVESGSVSYMIDSYIASDTEIQFITSGNLGNNDRFFIDNVLITATPDVGGGGTCSTYMGQATINEVSKESQNSDDANDFVELRILSAGIDSSVYDNWSLMICENSVDGCSTINLTSFDDSTYPWLVVKGIGTVGAFLDFSAGTDMVLYDGPNATGDPIDYLSTGSYSANQPSCTFIYDTDATTGGSTRRMRRLPDGVGDWDVPSGNSQPPTEGDGNDITTTATLYAEYRLDEASWSGSAGEVLDNSGNNLHGRAVNGADTDNTNPAKSSDPGTCGYGIFDGSNDYVVLPAAFENKQSSFTITAWINPTNTDHGSRILADDENNSQQGYALSLGDAGTGRLRFYSRGVSPVSVDTSSAVISTNTWTFVAGVHNATNKTREIYVNGVAQIVTGGGTSNTYSGNWGVDTGLASIGGETDSGETANRFTGSIDEVRVYDGALTSGEILAIYNERHACSATPTLDHYAISYSGGTALTCEPITVTITGHDSSHNPVAPGSGTIISLSTSTGEGRWSNPSEGILVDNGNGNADYSFGSSASITLNFNHASAGAVSFNINSGSSPNEGSGSEDPTVTFVDTGLRFIDQSNNPTSTHIAGKTASLDQLFVQAVRTDNNTGECVGVFASGTTVSLGMGAACINPSTCAGSSVDIDYTSNGSSASSTLNTVNSAASPDYSTTVAMEFGADSKAPFTLVYPDAGQMQLHARYEIVDGAGVGTGDYIVGASDNFVVKPAGLCVVAEDIGANSPTCSPLSATCSVYATVGDTFQLTVSGRTWESDADTDYCTGTGSSNLLTANFQLSNIALSSTVTLPAGANNGSLSPAAISVSSGGTATANYTIDQVGAFQFTATPPSYLGTTIAASNSDNVGRFIPHHYRLISSVVTPADQTGATSYSYMGQNFDVEYVLRAVDASNTIMANFRAANNNLTIASAATYGAIDSASASLNGRVSAGAATVTWGDSSGATPDYGEVRVELPVTITRQTGVTAGAADGPYAAVGLGLDILDGDSVSFSTSDYDLDTDNSGSDESINLGSPGDIRYGRVFMPPIYGPELPTTATVPIVFTTEFFNGSQFEINIDDGATTYDAWAVSCSDGTLACSLVSVSAAPASSVVIDGRSDRSALPTSTRPGVVGDLNLGLNVDAWLQFDWDGDTIFTDDPSALATFGTYRGHDRIIYWREKQN